MGGRAAVRAPINPAPATYTCGDLDVDCGARVVRIAGRRQLLTFGEFEVLVRLVECRGRVLTREELHLHLRTSPEASPRAVDTIVTRLRRKLAEAQLFQIETVQRVGYRCHWSPSSTLTLGTADERAARG